MNQTPNNANSDEQPEEEVRTESITHFSSPDDAAGSEASDSGTTAFSDTQAEKTEFFSPKTEMYSSVELGGEPTSDSASGSSVPTPWNEAGSSSFSGSHVEKTEFYSPKTEMYSSVEMKGSDSQDSALGSDAPTQASDGAVDQVDGEKAGKTEFYSPKTEGYDPVESDSSRPSGSKSSQAKTPGSDERVRREWDAAIGSADRGSGESIRIVRQEASDSVLERISVRKVADANVEKSQQSNFDYTIRDKLGEGGMGVVFSAFQSAVNRVVALKTLKKERNSDAGAQKQFFYEAEITADLDHPNIPPIYELGVTEQGTFFYTMKLIKGAVWHRIMSKRSQEENLEIFEKMMDAVGFAHSKRIINLDIKPQNVILGGYGEVYVTDWGMAHNIDKKLSASIGGTPDYMAPEIPRRAHDKIGPQTDIYLLGAVLFQILTGHPPHAGTEMKDGKKAANAKVMDAYHNRIRETDCDSPLLPIALKAMSTEPVDRYATVEEMQNAVRAILRENANRKASIELTKNSKSLAELAEKNQDYERFNRAIFGFRNAVEVWTGNQEAETELAKARFAYGNCAVSKGDYDLALQTLDPKVPEEATLLEKAQKAKTAVLNRESRFKFLRNAVFALLGLGAIGATAAALWINEAKEAEAKQRVIADNKTIEANQQKESAVKNASFALTMMDSALTESERADQNAEEAKENAKVAQKNAKEAEDNAKVAKKNEEKANANAAEAERQKENALARLAQVTVGERLSNLGIASAQVDKANPIDAAVLLERAQQVDEVVEKAFTDKPTPQLTNYASRRVGLLSNIDLKPQDLQDEVTAIDFAKGTNRGIAGTKSGRVVALQLQNGKLVQGASKKVIDGQPVVDVAISPSGDEAILSVGSQLIRWALDGDLEPMQEEVTKNRLFQGFAYSPDGSVVAGIRGGIWIKPKGGKWDNLTPNVKGTLLDVDWLGDRGVFVLSESEGERNLLFVPKSIAGNAREKPALVEKNNQYTQLGVLDPAAGKLVLASDGGSLVTVDFDEAAGVLRNRQSLARQHQGAVTQIDIDPASHRMVTGSQEAVVHVWKYLPTSGEVIYETFLTGTPGTSKENVIARTAMIDGKYIVNVDKAGSAVALDVDRQKQRRELTREDNYERVVIGLHPRGNSTNVLSVDENGAVDQWDLVTGKTTSLTGPNDAVAASRYSYFGHTPGAVLFDTAADASQGVVITSAVIPSSATRYAGNLDPNKAWAEFCAWDQNTGNMLRRWQCEMSDPVEPRLTLLGDGSFFVGGETRSLVFDYQGQPKFVESRDKPSATFAVSNPVLPGWVAMMRRDGGKGQLWLWDRNSGNGPELNNDLSILEESMPVHATWSQDGKRLYVLDVTGHILPYTVANTNAGARLQRAERPHADFKDPSILNALRSFQDVELVSSAEGSDDRVICNVRQRSAYRASKTESTDRTTTFTFKYSIVGEAPQLVGSESLREDQPKLLWIAAHPNHRVGPDPQVLSKLRAGNHVFVAMRNGRVYGLSEQGGNPVLYGRKKFEKSTSDRQGNRLLLLNEDGTLHTMNLDQGTGLKLAPYRLQPGEKRIALSPDGKQLAVYDDKQQSLRVVDAESGHALRQIPAVLEFGWDPDQAASLATLEADGSLKVEGQAPILHNLAKDLQEKRPTRLDFFVERWVDPNEAPVRYLVVKLGDEIVFVPRAADELKEGDEPKPLLRESIGANVQFAVSPTDSIFATGDSSGAIKIWFASPRYAICQEVYDLDRQDLSEVKTIVFNQDGDTLITSDIRKRVSAWMSRDKLATGE
ncbi:MAG: protein kinase domain-containing protein [Pirellula sp.]